MSFDYANAVVEQNSAADNFRGSRLHHIEGDGLVAAARRGGAAAFNELWQAHSKRILRITYRITKNREDAEDAVQDSFLNAFLHLHSFDGRSSFSTWLTRIAINSALMVLRKRGYATELSIDERGDRGPSEIANLRDRDPNPEAHFAQNEREETLRDAIRSLRPTIRRAVELHKLQEYSLKETAVLMGLSVTAAKSRLHHAKAELRASLKPKTIRRRGTTSRFRLLPAA